MHKDMKTRKLHARMKENLQKGFLYLRSCLSVLILFVRKDLNSSDSFCYICGSFTIPRHRTNISTFVKTNSSCSTTSPRSTAKSAAPGSSLEPDLARTPSLAATPPLQIGSSASSPRHAFSLVSLRDVDAASTSEIPTLPDLLAAHRRAMAAFSTFGVMLERFVPAQPQGGMP
ncbi:uncharacterized protein [Dendrobates tinctorius]|uniref:uncharacterized protein isoform X2 n=1 Tax=Dendrobates tinctorius TaxID=92724 RepID=UPI003CC9357E